MRTTDIEVYVTLPTDTHFPVEIGSKDNSSQDTQVDGGSVGEGRGSYRGIKFWFEYSIDMGSEQGED